MSETLQMLVARVRVARETAAAVDAMYRSRLEAFEADNADLIADRKRLQAIVAEEESILRAAAESHYVQTGEKKPVEGVSIRETVSVDYKEADAIAWAKTAMPEIVRETLDVKAFEKVAKAALLPFVDRLIEGKAVIGTTLPSAPVAQEAA